MLIDSAGLQEERVLFCFDEKLLTLVNCQEEGVLICFDINYLLWSSGGEGHSAYYYHYKFADRVLLTLVFRRGGSFSCAAHTLA